MPSLSIILFALVTGCAVHVGVIPPNQQYAVVEVAAPVAEPEVDGWVRDAVVAALASRGALGPAGTPLRVTVEEAAWEPSRRAGDVLLYQARIVLRFDGAGRTGTQTRLRTVVDPGNAGDARTLREATFRSLAREAAEDGVAWLATSP